MNSPRHGLSALMVPLLTITLVGNLVSCGTIMYPERNGQKAGSIDPLVAVLDGVGLLFFLIPGVIAFAVDFNNHSIYLPHGQHSRLTGQLDRAHIEEFLRARTGVKVDLSQPGVRVQRLDTLAQLDDRFAQLEPVARLAAAR